MEQNNTTRYIDRYKVISGKESYDGDAADYVCSPITVVNEAVKIMKINQAYNMAIKLTDSYQKFYEGCKDFGDLIKPEFREDVFYTLRNGAYHEGVPAALVCLLNKAKDMYEYPNLALSMIKYEDLGRYAVNGLINGEYSINDVINNVWKADIKIMSPYRKRVEHKNVVELYVEFKVTKKEKVPFNTVVLIPKDISDTISDKEVADVLYDEEKGLILNDRMLRFANGRLGITKSDVDMRGVF